MEYQSINSAEEYEKALLRIYALLNLEQTTVVEIKELNRLICLTEEYEDKKYPIAVPTQVEIMKFKLERI